MIGKGDFVRVLPASDQVATALHPSAVASLEAAISKDLRIILTFIQHAENMAQLLNPKGARLTRLFDVSAPDYHYGTDATGVLLRPIDDHGSILSTDGTRASLSAVYSVAILTVGLSLKEALT